MSKYFTIKGIEEDEIFRNLFIDYYPSLISFALYYVGDKTIAEDLVQEVFVKLWETRERWSAVDDFSAYVYQMVRFKCFNYLRAEKIRNEATRSFTEEIDITEINNYIAEETFRLVMNSMEDLPPACRTVFSDSYIPLDKQSNAIGSNYLLNYNNCRFLSALNCMLI